MNQTIRSRVISSVTYYIYCKLINSRLFIQLYNYIPHTLNTTELTKTYILMLIHNDPRDFKIQARPVVYASPKRYISIRAAALITDAFSDAKSA